MNSIEAVGKDLVGFQGPNPFHEGQAKTTNDATLLGEFFPTSTFWSALNNQHEILLGTRGSGKTAILRMLSYSCFRQLEDEKATPYKKEKNFIGFYLPLHLEFLSSLQGRDVKDENRLEYFQFAFNCAAIKSALVEIKHLINDLFLSPRDRLLKEDGITSDLCRLWFPDKCGAFSALSELSFEIDCLYQHEVFWADGSKPTVHPFAQSIFGPLLPALARVSHLLGLEPSKTTWIACVDEAEFLSKAFQKCINHFLRSEKRPIVVKLATLPYKHLTRETLVSGIHIEPGGNDFNYRKIDLTWDSTDFNGLSNRICSQRLEKAFPRQSRSASSQTSLEDFFGVIGNDDLIDYYREEFPSDSSESSILDGIISSLSEKRKKHFESIRNDPKKIEWAYFKRFAPVFYVRRMRAESRKGNRAVGWLAGAKTIRKLSDGNPRRLIQLMNQMFEAARKSKLTPKLQHRINEEFSSSQFGFSEGLPEFGIILKAILDVIGKILEERVHGAEMTDGGCIFSIQKNLFDLKIIKDSLQLGIDYSFLFVDEQSMTEGLQAETEYRLAHVVAAHFWLPMRRGEKITLQSRQASELIPPTLAYPRTLKESNNAVRELDLNLQFENE